MSTEPIRVDGDLFAAAESSGALQGRSAAEQLDHWARIGRELESSPALRRHDVETVLAGAGSYDALHEHGQALVRTVWEERVCERLASLDLTPDLDEAEGPWVEADETGRLVTHDHPGT